MIKNLIILIFFILSFILSAQGKGEGLKRSAIEHMKAGRYGEAIDLMNDYITQNPRVAEGYNLRAICYENRTQYEWARVDYRRAIKLDRSNSEYRTNLNRLINKWYPQLYEKINGYRREIAIDPKNPVNFLGVANCYRLLEEWELAEQWYDKYLVLDPDASPDEIIRYTNVLLRLKHITKGEKILRKWTEKHPDDWRLWSRHGWFSYWLGHYKDAQASFEKALSFKPFFKEAQEGLDLAKHEGYLMTLTAGKEYPIDRYFRILKNNPNNDEVRFKLIEELLKVERFEEAIQQLDYLRPNYEGTERFDQLNEQVRSIRETRYTEKINDLLTKVENEPTNRDAVKGVAEYYSKLQEYDKAEKILKNYLELIPDDDALHFLLAKIFSYDQNFVNSYEEINKAIELNPNNTEYKLLAGQLGVWLDADLDIAESRLSDVLNAEPKNLYALITLGTLNFQKQQYEDAKVFIDSAMHINENNPDVIELNQMLELQKMRNEEARLLNNLDEGRKMVQEGDCESGLPYYEEYLKHYPDKIAVRKELADVYLCLKRFDDAIQIYDEVLNDHYDYSVDKMRAKVILWSGDSLRAVDEFKRLVEENPKDMEAKLFLGDSYVKVREYSEARKIYESLADSAPSEYMINRRLGWLPPEATEAGSFESFYKNLSYTFLSYANLYPVIYFFNDNLSYNYLYVGSGLEVGLYNGISGGAKWLRGTVSGQSGSFNFSQFMWQLYFSFIKDFRFNLGYGQMIATNYFKHSVVEAVLSYQPEEVNYQANLSYVYGDASTILYSPYLVGIRLSAHNIKLDGYYEFRTGLRISGYYQIVYSEPTKTIPANIGNIFLGRMGRMFLKDLRAGYEYNYIDYSRNMRNLYYSPQGFQSHSIWADWFIRDKEPFKLTAGGKIGYVPESDFIVREAYIKAGYKVLETLLLQLQGFMGSSIQENAGYNSGAITLSASWKIY